MSTKSSVPSATTGRAIKVASWGLRILAAAAFLAACGAKLTGVLMMVGIFEHIGIGQWFRVVTGLVEVLGAIAILVPTTAAFGGLLLATTMFFATLTHWFVIGGSPVPAVVLLVVTATVAWLDRASLMAVLGRG
ncbi:DoxX family protein [Enterobacter ludwigii]|uniref:DoxX family protein n=1 Tax=Enterobacter ludwigii TaxID=299767 RepID=UPI003D263445